MLQRQLFQARSIFRSSPCLPTFRRISPIQARRRCGTCIERSNNPSTPLLPPTSPSSPTNPTDAPTPDHRTLATAQKLFITSQYSPGSPLFLPNGADLFNKLFNLLRAQYPLWGFREVITPTLYKAGLWKVSGHWENYADDMFHVFGGDDIPTSLGLPQKGGSSGTTTATTTTTTAAAGVADSIGGSEDAGVEALGLKPMNCPGHCLLFASEKRSYRDLPIRFADFSPLHRNEVTGSLTGLTRVRRFHQDDGHIFCTPSQISSEIFSTLDFINRTYAMLGLPPHTLALSTRPKEQFIGTVAEWDVAEEQLRDALKNTGREWIVKEGDGAFYGPKIDIMIPDSGGKMHQTATVQLDFQLPRRFGLEYVTENAGVGEEGGGGVAATDQSPAPGTQLSNVATPVMIHRAVLGSVERFLAILIEHYNGTYPFWLSPRPCAIVSVSNAAPTLQYVDYVRDILAGNIDISSPPPPPPPPSESESGSGSSQSGATQTRQRYHLRPLSSPSISITTDTSDRSLGSKLRHILSQKFGFVIVIGPRDVQVGTVNVRLQNVRAKEELASGYGSRSGSGGDDDVQALVTTLVEKGQANARPEVVRRMFVYLLENWK